MEDPESQRTIERRTREQRKMDVRKLQKTAHNDGKRHFAKQVGKEAMTPMFGMQ